ncbi:MAG: hypothetical protein DRO40_13010 [Thermoprotei archaeon]|nr:MAG: hypothetical protein DRO40_13010 [Thermoprotei archaeon]
MLNRSILKELVWVIVKLHEKYAGRGLGRTKLMKLLFLIDLEAKRRLSRTVTGLEWFRWFYGPFTTEIYPVLEELLDAGFIDLDVYVHDDLRTEYTYKVAKDMKTNIPKEVMKIVKDVVKKYAKKPLYKVLQDVYKEIGDKDLGEAIL